MATLTVGRNQQYGTIAAAVAAAHNGDTVSVLAGTYVNDVATVRTNIALVASGGQVVLLGTGALASGGALLTVAATATVDGFVFANAHAADGTAAGLLHTAGALTVRNSLFTGGQTGLLSTAGSTATVSVQASEFANNTANISVGAIQSLAIAGSYVHDAAGGDEVRSAAHATAVTSSRIGDNGAAAGNALNLPNGGTVSVQNSVLEKGAASTAAAIIRFGGGSAYANSSLSVSGNTVVTDKPGALLVQNGTTASAAVTSNQLYGFSGSAVSGLAVLSGNTVPVARPAVSTAVLIPWSVGTPTQFGRAGAVVVNGTVLTVGQGGTYATLGAALAAAHDGDTIDVAAGTYAVAPITVSHKVIIQGVNGLARFTAAPMAAGSAALFTTTADVTFRNIEVSGTATPGGSEAAIADAGGKLTVVNSTIHDNQAGIVATGAAATVGIYDTELARNGTPDGAGANVKVAGIGTLTLVNDFIHDALAGPEVSSTAAYTVIDGTRVSQAAGNGAADLALPNGGQVTITNSAVEKGSTAQAVPLIQVGGGTVAAGSTVSVSNTTLVSDQVAAPTVFVSGNPAVATTVSGDTFVGGTAGSTQARNGTVSGATVGTGMAINTAVPWTAVVSATGAATLAGPAVTIAASTAAAAEHGVLMLDLSGTAYQGNPQFQVYVDGVATGGTLTATASHAAGKSQRFTVAGTFAPGPHTVQVRLTNALAGAGGAGRTLSLDGAQFNGAPIGQPVTLTANGTTTLFTDTVAATPAAVTVSLSEDAWHGDAQALITVDGKVQNGIQTVTAPHASGQTEPMRFLVNLAPGAHTLGVTFLNDVSGPAGNRNLYVDSVDVAGQHYASAAATLLTGGTSNFAFTVAAPTAGANASLFVTAGTPQAASLIVPAP